jgi:tRNA(Ile)-lysidine synthase
MTDQHFFPYLDAPILCYPPSSLVDIRRNAVSQEMRRWIPRSGSVVLASSGGSDSLAMAVAVRMVIDDPSRVFMVHVDHGLRETAWKDRRCAMLQAWALGFEFRSVEVWVPRTGNVYEQGRHARYAALASVAGKFSAEVVMTAHHADDLVETMLMRLARGCPLHTSELISSKISIFGVDVVRPLLSCTREQLRHIAMSSGVPWLDDPSNENLERERALIRATVGKALKQYRDDFSSKAAASLLASRSEDSRQGRAPRSQRCHQGAG